MSHAWNVETADHDQRANVVCLIRFLEWAEEEAQLAAGDALAAHLIAEASASLRRKFAVQSAEIFAAVSANRGSK